VVLYKLFKFNPELSKTIQTFEEEKKVKEEKPVEDWLLMDDD
jgi:hypothetical protein